MSPRMMSHLVLQAPPETRHRRVAMAVPLTRDGSLHAELCGQFPAIVSAGLRHRGVRGGLRQ